MSNSVRPHRGQPTRLPRPWDSPGKNTGVGCHFLLQCMKVKSESEVPQSCLTLSNPMDCSLPGSSVHGIFQARVQFSSVAQSCPTLCDPMDCSLPGSSVHGIFQARVQFSSITQSCPTLCDPMNCSLPGSSVHGIFQARVLEWVAIAFSV